MHGPDIAEAAAGAIFRARDLIHNRIPLHFGIKYYGVHEIFKAGSEEAGPGALKDRFQICRSRSRAGAEIGFGSGSGS
jgi:hypothetical protein